MQVKKLKHPIMLLARVWEQTESGDTQCRYVSTGPVWAHVSAKEFAQPTSEPYGKARRYIEVLKVIIRRRKPDFQRVLWRDKTYQVVSPIYENYEQEMLSFLIKPIISTREQGHG